VQALLLQMFKQKSGILAHLCAFAVFPYGKRD